MPYRSLFIAISLASLGFCQSPADRRQQALADSISQDFEMNVQSVGDTSIGEYLQALANRLAAAARVKPLQIRVTQSDRVNVTLSPSGVLYLNGRFLQNIASEAELAGLLAHEMAHGPWTLSNPPPDRPGAVRLYMPPCALAYQKVLVPAHWFDGRRDAEREATAKAEKTLQAAGYDPEGVLSLFSKLSYEHLLQPAIVSDDLLALRADLGDNDPPADGYRIDSSDFLLMRNKLAALK